MRLSLRLVFFLGCLLALLVSCAAHSPRILAEKYRSIHVSVFKNETNEYAVEERLTHSMIDAFRRDGRLRVVPAKNADLELKGRITKITLLPTVYTNLDRAIGYTMNIVIIVDVIDNSSDEPILKDRSFSATGSFLLSSELSQARTQDATDSLSEAVLSQLLEGW